MSWWSDLLQKETQHKPVHVLPKTGEIIEVYNSENNECIGKYLVVDQDYDSNNIRFYELDGYSKFGPHLKAPKEWFVKNKNHWKILS